MTKVNEYDLIVAGAGPAGCALAAKTAGKGARVLLLEKEDDAAVSRDWVADVEKGAFSEAGVPQPAGEALFKEPGRTIMLSPSGRHEVALLPAPLTPVRTGVYVRELFRWASQSGAEVRTGSKAQGLILEGGTVRGVRVEEGTSRGEFSAPLVADCTGITGDLRMSAPAEWGLSVPVRADETVLARREVLAIDPEAAALAVERGAIPDGIRKDRMGALGTYSVQTRYLDLQGGFIDILIGIKPAPGLPTPEQRLEQTLSELPFVGERIFGDGAPIPIRRPLDSLVGDGFMVLGDSACQTIPAHGSGVASALIAADLAASTATRAIGEGRFDRASLWEYSHAFLSTRGPVLAYYDVIRKLTDRIGESDLEFLMGKRVLTAEEVYCGLVPVLFVPGPSTLARKVLRGAGKMGLLARFSMVGLKARRLQKCFERYPGEYDSRAFRSWLERLPGY